ncbi:MULTISPECIES: type II secretion system protein N [unclassified Legionella]|uniref:type II secretion system protein N n=1 Tax=unclassified Legionella TaxID=2622702 RepID=UPI00105423D6|nr:MULTISPECIES: type II secretion system protein N [unclassified Legionella]MDI9819464.1 type II secretion system protein N [Legionella sp. PL877]
MKSTKFLRDFNDPKIVSAVVIFTVSFVLFIWEILSSVQMVEKAPIAITSPEISHQENLRPDSPVFKTPLFGDYVPVNLLDTEVKQSMLDAEVLGVLFSNKEEDSQVIIRVGGGPEKTYVTGDSLPGGAIIKRISPNGIVVLHNGALESLSLPKNELTFELPAKPLIEE